MTFKDWMDVLQDVFVIATSIVAVYGIDAWRKEFRGKRKIELAEEVLELFYQAKDILASERFPAYFASEYSKRETNQTETPKQKQIRDLAHVTFRRYHKHNKIFNRIYALRYRVMAQFDKNSVAPFDGLKSVLDDLHTELSHWVMLWKLIRIQITGQPHNYFNSIKQKSQNVRKFYGAWEKTIQFRLVSNKLLRVSSGFVENKSLARAKLASRLKPSNLAI